MKMINIAAYKFIDLSPEFLLQLKNALELKCREQKLRGTILLADEGVNLFLAGVKKSIETFWNFLTTYNEFSDMQHKSSISDSQPFQRLVVKIKDEIIPMGREEIEPEKFSGNRITPTELKHWLDEGRDITLLDTRNDFEVHLGTFENARHLDIESFRSFPKAVEQLGAELKGKPLVLFCTGGIRCEKAAPLLEQKGFREIVQLEGGILKYFEECGAAHYKGECFVFDDRISLDHHLKETGALLCERCQFPVTVDEQKNGDYKQGKYCPHCARKS